MEEHPNAELVRRGYEAVATGDIDTLVELFADDVVWHEGGRNPLSGDHAGRDQVFGLFLKLAELTDGTLTIEVHDVLANDEHVAALVTVSASRKGRSYSGTGVDVFHVRDGKAVEVWDHVTDRHSWDDLLNA